MKMQMKPPIIECHKVDQTLVPFRPAGLIQHHFVVGQLLMRAKENHD